MVTLEVDIHCLFTLLLFTVLPILAGCTIEEQLTAAADAH